MNSDLSTTSPSLDRVMTLVRPGIHWLIRQFRDHCQHRQRTESALTEMQSRLNRIETALSQLAGTLQRAETSELAHNLDQVRLLSQNLGARMESLSREFIERHVCLPHYREFLRLHAALSDGETLLAEGVANFFDAQGLRLIEPSIGDAFEPREHQPIGHRIISEEIHHGTVASLFQAGLARDQRILIPARVEVFTYQPTEPHETLPQK